MFDDLSTITIVGFILSCASLYGPGILPDVIYIRNIDDFENKVPALWRRTIVGSMLLSISVLGILFLNPVYEIAKSLSVEDGHFRLLDSILFMGVLISWLLCCLLSMACVPLERIRRTNDEQKRFRDFDDDGEQ